MTTAQQIASGAAPGKLMAEATEADSISLAISEVAGGHPVIVVDSEEGEASLTFAAQLATPELVAFMVRHTSGFVCAPITESRADQLDLPLMFSGGLNTAAAYTVTTDARRGVSTGISAADRARTLRLLADPATTSADLTRPGHTVPIRVRDGGVLSHRGHAEAAIDLVRLAGLPPAAALSTIVSELDPTAVARMNELQEFSERYGIVIVTMSALIEHQLRNQKLVARAAAARIPLACGVFTAVGFTSTMDGREHVAFVYGNLGGGEDILVSVHTECLSGDVFGSAGCDCKSRLDGSLQAIAAEGCGVVVYIRRECGSGSSLAHLVHAQKLYGSNTDSHQMSRAESLLPCDLDCRISSHILRELGVHSMRLLNCNHGDRPHFERSGLSARVKPPTVDVF